jgi:LAO/AO transport system kinase
MAAGDSLAERVLAGDIRAASGLIRRIEDGDPSATRTLQTLFPSTGRAWVVGITGAPGTGKSTLTDKLIARYRGSGKSVGVIAVDPTSPFTGGAILGDRIRMQDHATDPGVFIRSLATRGNLGGLSRATGDCIRVMDAMGREVILVETVGVGQDEIDIAQMAHTTVVVMVPGMGDDIQAIKAGILEVADIFVVNKADLDGADRVLRELRGMLQLRHAVRPTEHDRRHRPQGRAARSTTVDGSPPKEWEPPILKVIAAKNEGVEALVTAIAGHQEWLSASGKKGDKERARAQMQFVALLRERLLRQALERLGREKGRLEEVSARIAERRADPYALAEELARQLEE